MGAAGADAIESHAVEYFQQRHPMVPTSAVSMTDILLIQPPIHDYYFTAKRSIPYGLACIAGALEDAGFSVRIVDALATHRSRSAEPPPALSYLSGIYGPPDRSPFGLFSTYRRFGYSGEHIRKLIQRNPPFLVGISSLFTPYEKDALDMADLVRVTLPECHIVMGGHHPTQFPERMLSHPSVDFVLRGDGELSMPELAHALIRRRPVSSVPGVCFRKPGTGLHISNPAYLTDLSVLPLPATHLLETGHYRRKHRQSHVVVSSRGCPMNCSYCCMGRHGSVPYRRRSVASVLEEIEAAAQSGNIGFIDFEDENLTLDRRWCLSLLNALRKRFPQNPPELRAMNGLHPATLDDELVSAMAEAGFKTLNLSIGSTHEVQQDRFGRACDTEAVDRCIDIARRVGMTCVGYIIAGAPLQCPETSVDDLIYMAQRRILCGLSIYYPAPGSRDFDRCRRLGVLPASIEQMRSSALPVSHTTTRVDAATLLRLSRLINFMKHLLDIGKGIPAPTAPPPSDVRPTLPIDRTDLGALLLSWFLHDAGIRGVAPGHLVVNHRINPDLARRLLTGIQDRRIHGVNGFSGSRLPGWVGE
ncbi:MAG: radical SAM protein [Desulfobacterales bacterium]|jgi:hypothetical protein